MRHLPIERPYTAAMVEFLGLPDGVEPSAVVEVDGSAIRVELKVGAEGSAEWRYAELELPFVAAAAVETDRPTHCHSCNQAHPYHLPTCRIALAIADVGALVMDRLDAELPADIPTELAGRATDAAERAVRAVLEGRAA